MGYKITSDFHAYRGTTSTANQEILDFSVFGGGKHTVKKFIFVPDSNCSVCKNNQSFNSLIEGGVEFKESDMDITSLKIFESGTPFYIQYWIG